MTKKKRKSYSREFKLEAVGLITKKGYSIAEASGGMEEILKKDIDPRKACEKDSKRMFERGELRKGMTVEECISILCK